MASNFIAAARKMMGRLAASKNLRAQAAPAIFGLGTFVPWAHFISNSFSPYSGVPLLLGGAAFSIGLAQACYTKGWRQKTGMVLGHSTLGVGVVLSGMATGMLMKGVADPEWITAEVKYDLLKACWIPNSKFVLTEGDKRYFVTESRTVDVPDDADSAKITSHYGVFKVSFSYGNFATGKQETKTLEVEGSRHAGPYNRKNAIHAGCTYYADYNP